MADKDNAYTCFHGFIALTERLRVASPTKTLRAPCVVVDVDASSDSGPPTA